MKILQINTVYGTGSTGKITASIKEIIQNNGHEAYVAYGRGAIIHEKNFYRIGNGIDFVFHVLLNFLAGKSGFGSKGVTKRFLRWVDEVNPDIIHIHNLHGFFINIDMLFKYINEKGIPVVWTLHDCWPFTGQCAYFDYVGCVKWKSGCYRCPIYRTEYPYSIFKDNSKKNYETKKRLFTGVNKLTIISPSEWLATLVKESYLKEYEVYVVNNGIDISIYNRNHEGETVSPNIDSKENKIVLAVANVWDKRKGLQYILRLASDLIDYNEYTIVIIGLSKRQKRNIDKEFSNSNLITVCRTNNQEELAEWYRKAYVYVNPTMQDNFPTTNIEALACGTPVITFRTGGSPESITNKNGYVIEKGDYDSFKKAILGLEVDEEMRKACRESAYRYDRNKSYIRYLDIYQKV